MADDREPPWATYRLQMNDAFRFEDAQAIVPYLSRLGVTHAYSSPILRARPGSTHGYDTVDPSTTHPTIGDQSALQAWVTTLHNYGLGLLLDIVPNHMATAIENPYWRDVLTYGRSSPFAPWFDIDWRMADPEMWGRVLVPALGEPLHQVLRNDQIHLVWRGGRFLIEYFDRILPVDPATVPSICSFGLNELEELLETNHPALKTLEDVLAKLEMLPRISTRMRRRVDIDREDTERTLGQLAQLISQSPRIEEWANRTAEQFTVGQDGRRRLKSLLGAQSYRLVHWREAARTINYRRFFDINDLIAVRQEDPQVFADTHSTILRWVGEDLIAGLRIDHIDGLRDPRGYLQRLVEATSNHSRGKKSVAIFVEKILAHDEQLPADWPANGTTGYEFANQVEAIFVSPTGFSIIEEFYRQLVRKSTPFSDVAAAGKRRILQNELAPHIGRLAELLQRLIEKRRNGGHGASERVAAASVAVAGQFESDDSHQVAAIADREELSKKELVQAIVEVFVALPCYRTYIDNNRNTVSAADRQYLRAAVSGARATNRATARSIDFLECVLLSDEDFESPDVGLHERNNFIQRFQQLTGPAAAKGIEDTALYVYAPLASLNEVGGKPDDPIDDAVTALHKANEQRAESHPRMMLAATTHDTKRSADARARLDVLSEIPEEWADLVRKWRRRNKQLRSMVEHYRIPDPAIEYLFYQSLVAIWPVTVQGNVDSPDAATRQSLSERLEQYMIKAVREAKTFTQWTSPNQEYEDALLKFVRELLAGDQPHSEAFLRDVQDFVSRIARFGFIKSLSRSLIQFTAPGTPDLYQGDELWNFTLVDPDNRRPVDYTLRQKLLDEVVIGIEAPEFERKKFVQSLVDFPQDGRIKLHVIHTALSLRRENPTLFAAGDYMPLTVEGLRKDNLVAFARVHGESAVIVAAPRLTVGLASDSHAAPIGPYVWENTTIQLPDSLRSVRWKNALTRELIDGDASGQLRAKDIFASFPAGLLQIQR